MSETQPQMVRRFERRTDEPDDYTYDILYVDRLTGRTVMSYDGADPANTSAAYGAKSDAEYMAQLGFDIEEEIDASRSVVPVKAGEAAHLLAIKARRAEREAEEEAARDLLDFLGDEASDFDFENWNRGERDILEPALTRRGFTNVGFYMAEQDSFGPLIRGCVAYAPDGQRVRFFYG